MSGLLIWDKLPPFQKNKNYLPQESLKWFFFTPFYLVFFFCSNVNRRNLKRYFPSSSPFLSCICAIIKLIYANATNQPREKERQKWIVNQQFWTGGCERGKNWWPVKRGGGCDVIFESFQFARLSNNRVRKKERRYTYNWYSTERSDFGWFTPKVRPFRFIFPLIVAAAAASTIDTKTYS